METVDVEAVVYREGAYVIAQCLNVDVSSFGESEDDAVANLTEALGPASPRSRSGEAGRYCPVGQPQAGGPTNFRRLLVPSPTRLRKFA